MFSSQLYQCGRGATASIDSQKDDYTVVDIPPGMIKESEAFFLYYYSYFYST
jgi:hypothetical protein